MPDIPGYNPDKDYPLDPKQMEPEYVCKCDECDHCILENEWFFQFVFKKYCVTLCEDCYNKIQKCMVTSEEIIYE